MKKKLTNILAAAAVIGALALSCTAPWWAVWFLLFPVIYSGVLALIHTNTNYITEE